MRYSSAFRLLVFCLIPIVAGLYFLYLAYEDWKLVKGFEKKAVTVDAVVKGYMSYEKEDRDDDGNVIFYTVYHPVLQYMYQDSSYTQHEHYSSTSKDYQINDIVSLLIDPDQPNLYKINSFSGKWSLISNNALGGLAALLIPVYFYRRELWYILNRDNV
jgi:hypothetical protein